MTSKLFFVGGGDTKPTLWNVVSKIITMVKFILEGNYPIHPPSNNSVNLVLGKTHILCLKFTLPILDVNASNIIFSEFKKNIKFWVQNKLQRKSKKFREFFSFSPSLRQYYIITKLVGVCVCVRARIKSVVELD